MQSLKDFLLKWGSEYEFLSHAVTIFNPTASVTWSRQQKKLFVRLFYHARGHFDRFLWIMASMAPSTTYRSVILQNITDELGGLREGDLSHEQLLFRFAKVLDPQIEKEVRTEENYLPFLKAFNKGHVDALLKADWDYKWAMFSAYEHLDNVDYENLLRLVEGMGVTGNNLEFFNVHRKGNHFEKTFLLLEEVWNRDSRTVRQAFDFIGRHQLSMWRSMSRAILRV